MRLRDFIRQHRAELDEIITRAAQFVPKTATCYCPKNGTDHYHDDQPRINDEERRQWIMSDEGLYRWARSEGVKI